MRIPLVATLALAAAGGAWAQATVKEDGQWRAALGAAFASASGNTESTSINVVGDAVKATPQDKWAIYANALYAESAGTKTADQMRVGTKYDWNFAPQWYAFGTGEFERDKIAALDSRFTLGGGVGWWIVKRPELSFEVFGGAGFVSDSYGAPRLLDGRLRTSYDYPTALLGESSTHKLGESTTAKQRLVIYPNLKNTGEYRAQWDGGIAVAINKTLSLTAGLSVRTNSDPGAGVKKTDTLFTTGVSVKFE